ncbi:MAG: histidinol dehydrogenase [Victivallales bacterium]|nr:histidinol dehydrogenase [Victivallales bacterium]
MEKIYYQDEAFAAKLEKLYHRAPYPPEIETSIRRILDEVRKSGDAALVRYAKKFDRVALTPAMFPVDEEEIKKAARRISADDKKAIKQALANVMVFSAQRIPQPWSCSPRPGVIIGERFEPMERIGVYIPGGTAPLVSTVIHTAGLAKAAGVKEIVAVTPPAPDGTVHPAVLYAMRQAGVTEIYRLGGVYGIAALAFGTESIRKVDKVVGPGNAYVTAAKKLVYGEVALDLVAGPSEIMIIADEKCNPAFIAADMLSQAEHGSGFEQAVLLSTDAALIDEVAAELFRQQAELNRRQIIDRVLADGVFLIQVKDTAQAAEIAGRYAPEHLEIQCRQAGKVAKQVKAAGAIFIGQWTPEPIGDFCAGPSHVLPTAGSGKYFSGLTVEGFFRRMSILHYQKSALKQEVETAVRFAEMEGLDAHGRSAAIRFANEKTNEY